MEGWRQTGTGHGTGPTTQAAVVRPSEAPQQGTRFCASYGWALASLAEPQFLPWWNAAETRQLSEPTRQVIIAHTIVQFSSFITLSLGKG